MSELKNTFEFFKNQLDNITDYCTFIEALRADGYDLKPSNTGHLAGVSRRAANAIVQDLEDAITPIQKLEVGKTYKARNGSMVDLVADLSKYVGCGYSFIGVTYKGGAEFSVDTYCHNGAFMEKSLDQSPHDLIAEHVEPAQEQEPTEPKPFEVGDEVCCATLGNGIVTKENNGGESIHVSYSPGNTKFYFGDGRIYCDSVAPTLRHGHNSWPHIADLQK